jgi:hypothetical protein
VAGRAGEGGGVKVERPQPEARTYHLDATVRRTLRDDGVGSALLTTGSLPVFASDPSVSRWLRGQARLPGISSSRWWVHDAMRPRPRWGPIS